VASTKPKRRKARMVIDQPRKQPRGVGKIKRVRKDSPAWDKGIRQAKRIEKRNLERRYAQDPLYNPTAPLAGLNLHKASRAVTNAELNPQLKAFDRQRKVEKAQGKALSTRAGDYYEALARSAGNRVARTQAISDRLSAELKSVGADTQENLQAAGDAAQKAVKADTELRGEGLDAGADAKVAEETRAARERAAGDAQNFRSSAAAESGSHERFTDAMDRSQQMRGGEIQGELANRLATRLGTINSDKAALAGTRGARNVKNLLDLRQTGFENLVTMKGLDIDRAEIEAEANESAAERRLKLKLANLNNKIKLAVANKNDKLRRDLQRQADDVRLAIARENIGSREAIAQLNEGGRNTRHNTPSGTARLNANQKEKGENLLSTPDSQDAWKVIHRMLAVYRSSGSMSEAAAKLRKKEWFDPTLMQAAADIAGKGTIGRSTIRSLNEAGAGVPKRYRPKQKKRNKRRK
jgi:hypothetical protein